MVGNHRDAWTYGAVDPGSGTRRDAGDVPGARRSGEGRLEAAPDARLRELGRRGVRPRRLDRVGRGARRGARREGRAAPERRFGRLRPDPRHRRRPLAARPRPGRGPATSTTP